MDIDKDIEAELAELMAATTKGLNPPPGIIEQGVRRGRRLQLVNRIRGGAAAIGVLAVTAGATFGAVAVADRPAGDGHALGAPAPSASAAPSVSAVPSASAAPTTPAATPRTTPSATKHPKSGTKHGQMSLKQVEAILADLLPPGRLVRLPGIVSIPNETHYGATYFPGTRGYLVAIDIVPSSVPDASNSFCSVGGSSDDGSRQAGAPPIGCEERNLPGGAHVVLTVTNTDYSGLYEYEVILDRADGMQVTMELANGTEGPDGQPGTVNAATPPLTMDQLLSIAESDRWN